MLSVEEIKRRLKDSNYRAVAKSSNINYHTLCKFMKGEGDPKHSTVTLLSTYLMSLEGKENGKS